MADPVAQLLDHAATAASLLGGGFLYILGSARKFFEGSDSETTRVNKSLEDLQTQQIAEINHLIDSEAQSKSPDKTISTEDLKIQDDARKNAVESCIDYLWEDALRARYLELRWIEWRRWERMGRRVCEAQKFMYFVLWVVLLVDLSISEISIDQSIWLIIGFVAVVLPFIIAAICWMMVTIHERRVTTRLDVPRRGKARNRRFGDA